MFPDPGKKKLHKDILEWCKDILLQQQSPGPPYTQSLLAFLHDCPFLIIRVLLDSLVRERWTK